MNDVKKYVIVVVGLALLIMPVYVFGVNSTSKSRFGNFIDVDKSHPFAGSINSLKRIGILKGYADGTFKPDMSVSRAEFVTMVMTLVDKKPTGANCFKDVKNEWFANYVCAAKAKGLVSGYPDGTFKPQNNINFAEASVVVAKAAKLSPVKSTSGTKTWYKVAVEELGASAAIPTTIDYPEKKISRAETAEMIWRLKTKVTNKPTKSYATLTASLPKISSCGEIKEKVMAYQYQQNSRNKAIYIEEEMNFPAGDVPTATGGMQKATESKDSALPSESSAEGGEAGSTPPEFSSTNVQVEGVDEGDVIKNDAEFIYMVSGNTVRIIKAYPPDAMSQVSKLVMTDSNFTPSDLYVFRNKLVVIGSTYGGSNESSYSNRSKIYVVDTTDKTNLKEERSVEVDGITVSSRRINNLVYIVTHNWPVYFNITKSGFNGEDVLPQYKDSKVGHEEPVCGCEDVSFLPKAQEPDFLTIASINIEDPNAAMDKEVIMGTGDTVYASVENLYVAGTEYDYPEAERFDIYTMPPNRNERTVIFQFGIQNGDVTFKSKGTVKGHLLNQFSMDESENAFRIATTTGEVWEVEPPAKNHLFILDKNNLETVLGKIEDIAPGEKIYSVRFLGKRAYMVTFKKVDPFFVIDVGDPANPKILGALKIPGYSDYLHPYDENHIIGFGKEAVDPQKVEDEWPGRDFDFAWYQGMKIALFDVTDVTNPTMMFKEMIGDRGTDSELLYNHKALLYDKTRNLFALPVTVAQIKDKTSPDQYTGDIYGDTVFQGAYVYTLDLQNGFQLKGKITHYDDPDFLIKQGSSWYEDNNTIKRILYIGDYLYTVSLGKIKATKRDTMEEANKIELEVDEQTFPYILE